MKRLSEKELRGLSTRRLQAHAVQYELHVRRKGFRLQRTTGRNLAANRSVAFGDSAQDVQTDQDYLALVRRIREEQTAGQAD